jgi:hypothetical protein
LLELPEVPPSRLPRSSLSPDSVARLVNAETVAAVLEAEVGAAVEPDAAAAVLVALAALAAVKALYKDAELELPTLPIDIIHPQSDPTNEVYRHRGPEL